MNCKEFDLLVNECETSGMDKTASDANDLTSRAQKMIAELKSRNIKQASVGNMLEQVDLYIAKTADEIREDFDIESNRGVGVDEEDIFNCFMKGWQ